MTEFRKFSAALDDAKLTLQTAAATDNSDSATARRDAAEAIRRRCADGDLRRTADKFAAKLEATDDVTEPTFLATLQTARRVRDAAAARVHAEEEGAAEELAAAEEQEKLRLRALTRQKDLVDRGVGTAAALENAELSASGATQSVLSRKAAVDQAKNRGAQAETRLVRAELALKDAKRKLEDTELYAEFSGLLSGVSLVKGGIVSANERLGQLIDPKVLEVSFKISTQQYTRLLNDNGELLKVPVSVALTSTDQGLDADGVIIRDSASVAKGQTGRQVYARLTKSVGFKPGDFVAVKVEEPTLNWVVKLPSTALDASNNVLLLGEGERLEEAQVKLMRRQGNEVIVRSRDLSGKEIVAQRTPVLGAGIKVKPIRSGEENKVTEVEMLELTEERRAKLISAIETNGYIPKSAKERIIGQLTQPKVPADVVARIESRMGG